MTTARLMSGAQISMFNKSVTRNCFPLVVVVLVLPLVLTLCVWVRVGGLNWPVEVDIGMLLPKFLRILTPSWLIAVLLTSANRTCSDIWAKGVGGTSIKLVTFGAAFLTTSRILSAT